MRVHAVGTDEPTRGPPPLHPHPSFGQSVIAGAPARHQQSTLDERDRPRWGKRRQVNGPGRLAARKQQRCANGMWQWTHPQCRHTRIVRAHTRSRAQPTSCAQASTSKHARTHSRTRTRTHAHTTRRNFHLQRPVQRSPQRLDRRIEVAATQQQRHQRRRLLAERHGRGLPAVRRQQQQHKQQQHSSSRNSSSRNSSSSSSSVVSVIVQFNFNRGFRCDDTTASWRVSLSLLR